MTTSTFTKTCLCGEPVPVVDGVELMHECRPITTQQLCDAWADGYAWGKSEDE